VDGIPITTSAHCCPSLEKLKLYGLHPVHFEALIFCLGRSCRLISTLNIVDCTVTSFALRCIAGMEALRDLTLDSSNGVAAVDIVLLVELPLTRLDLNAGKGAASIVLAFPHAPISRTLQRLCIIMGGPDDPTEPTRRISDSRLATALACCPQLIDVALLSKEGVFGRRGVAGLQAMAAGCPLLSSINLPLTVGGLFCVGARCPNLRMCVSRYDIVDLKRICEDLQTLYPKVKWMLGADYGFI
jgi:hypothetical protein